MNSSKHSAADGTAKQSKSQPAAELPFGSADPDPFMLPLEAAQLVQGVSPTKIGLDTATRELERALAEGQLSILGRRSGSHQSEAVPEEVWAHHTLDLLDAATLPRGRERQQEPAWRDLRFRRKDVLKLWPGDPQSVDKAHELPAGHVQSEELVSFSIALTHLHVHLGLEPPAGRKWLIARVDAGAVEPITQQYNMTEVVSSGRPGRGIRLPRADRIGFRQFENWPSCRAELATSIRNDPAPGHWHFRKRELMDAIQGDPHGPSAPWRTTSPGPSLAPWVSYDLARSIVARESGYDLGRAATWLAHMRPPVCEMRIRFRPSKIAALERASEREGLRLRYPTMILDAADIEPSDIADSRRLNQCGWFSPAELLAFDPAPPGHSLTTADMEWDVNELRTALGQEFLPQTSGMPVAPKESTEVSGALSQRIEGEKRGPKPTWDWAPILSEAKLAYARTGGEMAWKNLVALMMDSAEHQTGIRPKSDSTAEKLAAKVRSGWKGFIGEPDD